MREAISRRTVRKKEGHLTENLTPSDLEVDLTTEKEIILETGQETSQETGVENAPETGQ